jgi:prophage antirepressor-like protein
MMDCINLKELSLIFKNNYLKYNGKNVLVIVDKDGVTWFRGIDVANLLDYNVSIV